MLRYILFLILASFSFKALCEEPDDSLTSFQVSETYDSFHALEKIGKYQDFVEKEDKIHRCIEKYVATEAKSFAKKSQGDLYDLTHNMGGLLPHIYGGKTQDDDTTYIEKLEKLGLMQCEAYYRMGVLK